MNWVDDQFTLRVQIGADSSYIFPLKLQRLIYWTDMETHNINIVLNRVLYLMVLPEGEISNNVIEAVLGLIKGECHNLASKSHAERNHWTEVTAPEADDDTLAVPELLNRVTHGLKPEGTLVVSYHLGLADPDGFRKSRKSFNFDLMNLNFIYNATEYAFLTRADTSRAFCEWSGLYRADLRGNAIRRIVQYINYRQQLAPPHSTEAAAWDEITAPSHETLDLIRANAPIPLEPSRYRSDQPPPAVTQNSLPLRSAYRQGPDGTLELNPQVPVMSPYPGQQYAESGSHAFAPGSRPVGQIQTGRGQGQTGHGQIQTGRGQQGTPSNVNIEDMFSTLRDDLESRRGQTDHGQPETSDDVNVKEVVSNLGSKLKDDREKQRTSSSTAAGKRKHQG